MPSKTKMNKLKVHFSSFRQNWRTPKYLYDILDKEFNFNFDPCPTDPNFDGLKISWKERNFVNPPYGRDIGKWIEKGYQEYLKGKLIVFLIPSRTDTKYWHDYIMKATEIRFIEGRICFDDCGSPAPFPSAIIVFDGTSDNSCLSSIPATQELSGEAIASSPIPSGK